MDYERIDKPQTGIISPSKLRVKLMGVSNQRKKEGSNCNSSRTCPSRLEDSEFLNNSLLASNNDDFDETASSLEPPSVNFSVQPVSTSVQNPDADHIKVRQASRGDSGNGNSSAVHPLKPNEDENLDYDSNASSSSFEFHKGERMGHRPLTQSLSRPTSYKWNDAEKWIMSKQGGQANYSKGHGGHSAGNRITGMNMNMNMNMVRVAPEGGTSYDYRLPTRVSDTKRVDFSQTAAPISTESEPIPVQSNGANVAIDLYPQSMDLNVGNVKNSTHDVAGTACIRAISMRDMGTEMTPMTSQEPSRTATPVGATTPMRSPTSSLPSTPRGELETIPPLECKTDSSNTRKLTEKGDKELSEQELKLKTRREIVARGVELGKMNIAAWASKNDKQVNDQEDELELRTEHEKRAAAWEEAEKTKHAARYKREEIRIQAWESEQKAKLEEELRRIEAKVERLRRQSQAKMVKKIGITRKILEEKRASAEARKKSQAEKTAAQADYIRQIGRISSSDYICCGLFSY